MLPSPVDLPDMLRLLLRLANSMMVVLNQTSICETTPGVKSYAGYVHLPPGTLNDMGVDQSYPINTFFWFFKSRRDPANDPLSIWMNGGPGGSSLVGLFNSNGPCHVNHDSASTTLNPWSWNNEVNMLYIDQPNQVGLSYDILVNGTLDLLGTTVPVSGVPPNFAQNDTMYAGTFPSNDGSATANTTMNAARSLWYFAQVWLRGFPEYKVNDDRISVWTESYGARYGLAFAGVSQQQDEKIKKGIIDGRQIRLDSLGLLSGCVDLLIQSLWYPKFAFNNTYGIQAIDEQTYEASVNAYEKSGGCRDKIQACRRRASDKDPGFYGSDPEVNGLCVNASSFCRGAVEYPYMDNSNRSYYDIARADPDPFPGYYYLGYLAQPCVQEELGTPVNFTALSSTVSDAFDGTGDYARGDVYMDQLSRLLDSGVKVALVHGDRDYACNWLGGEQVSLAVEYSDSSQFHEAGYADIETNLSYIGGQVRQHGNFSFSRVFQAGHEVGAFQPQTAFEIFQRVMFDRDVATGEINTAAGSSYSTIGPSSSFYAVKQVPPPEPEPVCYLLSLPVSCTEEQQASVVNDTAVFKDYLLVEQ